MGFSVMWYAVRGAPRDQVLAAFRWEVTDEAAEFPDAPVAVARHRGEWELVHFQLRQVPMPMPPPARLLAAGREIVACCVDETTMTSAALGWLGRRELWSVVHRGHEAVDDLTVEGDPPDGFARARDACFERQRSEGGADCVFEVPVLLAEQVVGFRHDGAVGELDWRVCRRRSRDRAAPRGCMGAVAVAMGAVAALASAI